MSGNVGSYAIKDLGNGRYSVAVTNGNYGACVTDARGVTKLLETQSQNSAPLLKFNNYIYDNKTSNSLADKFLNIYRLEDTNGLEGFDLAMARMRNMVACYYNPFALGTTIKNVFA